ncbi:CPXCG motif-containing cysteine-rich protein [Methylomarinum sp. Ch1-1]|uniref:CPXCG motif-containing cysteine-rich protein n=1 Tax=Methylomarinum roseum TaxID=3067653 RepID=A0AAU7NWF4_9GAMM|nr:CPXCG motif-containing cysteine-rich protein [Methylomarinum sp. Ch1-1]MDP4522675.1 CPXCG motif-containing cysteine-rich protein [Methylomarinum sp. Ch1-1]
MQQLQEFPINCPYCGENITVLVDASSGGQQYYEDCQVCCAPIFITLEIDEEGKIMLSARRDDE